MSLRIKATLIKFSTSLPPNFPLLSHITKLDLSKNGLTELPENFGNFKALKSLDLYANRWDDCFNSL